MTIPASKKNTPQNNATDLLVQCIYVVVHFFLSQVIFVFLSKNTNNYPR